MGKKKGQKKPQEGNPKGSAQAPEQQQNPEQSGQAGSQNLDQDQRPEGRSVDQRQASVPSQSSSTMEQPASSGSKKQKLPASGQGKSSDPAAKQPTATSSEKAKPPTQETAPARTSSAPSAETKSKGEGRSGGQSAQQTSTSTSQSSEQATPAESKSKKKKQKIKSQEAQKPAASAKPSPSTSGVEDILTDVENLTLKTESEASTQQTTSAQQPTKKPAGTKKGKGKSEAQLPHQTAASTVPEKTSLKPTETKASGKKQKGKDSEVQKAAASATPSSSSSGVGDTLVKEEKRTLYDIPKRKGTLCDKVHMKIIHDKKYIKEKLLRIEVNYLPLNIKKPQLKIYHYDVKFTPDVPKFLLRDALKEMISRHFPGRYPAFDGKSNIFVAGEPLRRERGAIQDTVIVRNVESDRDKEFVVTINPVDTELTVADLFEHCRTGITSNTPQIIIQATDVALRNGLTDKFTPAGRSFFTKPSNQILLNGGMELWHGFYQSAVAAWKPFLNIDVANKAFPVQQPVFNYLKYDMMLKDNSLRNGLNPKEKQSLKEFICGLKIEYEMPNPGGEPQKRTFRVTGLGGTCVEESFEHENRRISVDSYFKYVKRCNLVHKNLPLLQCGPGRFLPIELCSIVGKQAIQKQLDSKQTTRMVEEATKPAFDRKRLIEKNFQMAKYAHDPTLNEFGIEVETNFENVDAVVIRPPEIAYVVKGKPVFVSVNNGTWFLNENFYSASQVPSWGILNLNKSTDISELNRQMVRLGSGLGMSISNHQHYIHHDEGLITDNELVRYLREFQNKQIQLVIVILADSSESYGQVKRISELRVGVLTQCLKSNTLGKIKRSDVTVKNILLKLNAKLRGVNHSIAPAWKPTLLKKPFMLVGADVTHPAPGPNAESTPSIAAVAASQDTYGFQYKMNYQLQPSRQELITGLAEMMKEHLDSFKAKYKREPANIFYFRDGVSEGQFRQVLETELRAIKRACAMVRSDYEARVLVVVVQKRHHTRFFPKNSRDGDKNGNVPAGTLVDHTITHPTEFDYYLVSHQSIQGTARPTKYHLLWDDLDYSSFPDEIENPQFELERLTFYLCHMFSRCTRSVSYPAPTYYAHLAAFRARAWWSRETLNMAQLAEEQERRGTVENNIIQNYPMFFT